MKIHVIKKAYAKKQLSRMKELNPELYDRIMKEPGFSDHFQELCRLSFCGDDFSRDGGYGGETVGGFKG